MSKTGLVAAAVYLCLAAGVLIYDFATSSGGGWISLRTLVPYLVTLPVSAPLEKLGLLPDLTRWSNVGALMLICAVIIYKLGEWLGGLFTSGSR